MWSVMPEGYDLGLLYWFNSWRSPWLNPVVILLTHLGGVYVLLSVVLLGGLFLVLRHRPQLAVIFLIASLSGRMVEVGIKQIVDRPRPDLATRVIDLPGNPSFPSGHALCSMAIYGSLAVLLSRLWPRWRRAMLGTAVGLSLVIGLTRIILGVHYPADVLVGWLLGLLFVALAHTLAMPRTRPESPP